MKSYKMYVMNEEQSRQAQEKAFECGYSWNSVTREPAHIKCSFFYFSASGKIYCGDSFESYKDDSNEEISFHDWMNMKKEDVLEEPSHEDIMTLWWKDDNDEWFHVMKYDSENKIYCIDTGRKDGWCTKTYFAGRESAKIPPQ